MNFAVYQTEKGALEVRPVDRGFADSALQVSQSYLSKGRAIVEWQELVRGTQSSSDGRESE